MKTPPRFVVARIAAGAAAAGLAVGAVTLAQSSPDSLDPPPRPDVTPVSAEPSPSNSGHGDDDAHRADHTDRHVHAAAMALVDPASATHVARASGDWSTPGTWAGDRVPGERARVHVPIGVTITVDGVIAPEIKTIGVDGTLRFAPDVDTELRVDTVVTTPTGTLEIGTPSRPISSEVVARIVFADDGPIDRSWDPTLLSRGAILHGTTVVRGAEVTHRTTVAEFPRAGDTSIELSGQVIGWSVGDEIVITGTNGPTSDERRIVTSVDGTTVGIDQPLAVDHVPPAADLDLYVANLTRNVRFTSENTDVDRRGHLMVMHTLDADIRGARFTDMGRTDKSRELDDVAFDDIEPGAVGWDGTVEQLGGDNVRGRYTVHVHRGGADPRTTPAVIADSVVTGDPGWAFTNHSSHVDFLRNVAYDNAGAGFFTEAGDETGRWIDNIAIRTVMPTFELDDAGAIDPDLRADRQDFGIDGDGYWLQGNRVDLIGNVSAGASAHGIIWWSEALAEADLARVSSVAVDTLPDPSLVPGRDTIPVWWAPLGEVRDNVSYGAVVGIRARYIHGASYLNDPASPPAEYIETLRPVIEGVTIWDVRDGVLMNYNERLTLRNIRAIGTAEPFRHNYGHTAAVGVGLDVGNDATFGPGTIEDVHLSGFEVGLIGPRHGAWTIDDVTTAATTDVLLHSPEHTERSLDMTDLTFAPLGGTRLAGRDTERRHVVLAYDYAGDGDGVDPSTGDGESDSDLPATFADRVTWGGRGLYSPAQAPDAVPMGEGPYEGLTNQQLVDRGVNPAGGTLLPADAAADPRVTNGLVGGPAPVPTINHVPGLGAFFGEEPFELDDDDRNDADEPVDQADEHGDAGDDDRDDPEADESDHNDEADLLEELARELADEFGDDDEELAEELRYLVSDAERDELDELESACAARSTDDHDDDVRRVALMICDVVADAR